MQANNPPSQSGSSSSSLSRTTRLGNPAANGRSRPTAPNQGGTSRMPRIYSERRTSTTQALNDDPDAGLEDAYAYTLNALNGQLSSLLYSSPLVLEPCLALLDAIKATEHDIGALLRDCPDAKELGTLAHRMENFLTQLSSLLCRDAEILGCLDLNDIDTICVGLAACLTPAERPLFDAGQLQNLKPALQDLTDALMRHACVAGLLNTVASNEMVLNILNWVSRGLKNHALEASQSINGVFDKALELFDEHWLGSAPPGADLSTHQVGKCAVQINTIVKFMLPPPNGSEEDNAGRARLARCGRQLCAAALLDRFKGVSIDEVVCTNISNLVKDLIEKGLLAATEPSLQPGLIALTQLISRIPSSQLSAGDCRTLANCANFLRVLLECHALVSVQEQPFVLALHLEVACRRMLNEVSAPAFMQCWPSAQAVSNLLSFVKRYDRHLTQSSAANPGTTLTTTLNSATTTTTTTTTTATTTRTLSPRMAANAMEVPQHALREAAGHLLVHLLNCGSEQFRQPEAISGALSGLTYLLQRNLVPKPQREELLAFLRGLMGIMASCSAHKWKDKSRAVALPALCSLIRMDVVTLEAVQPALASLLGAHSRRGAYSEHDLARIVKNMGVAEEKVVALPTPPAPAAVAASPPAPAASAASPPPRPGYTRIIPPSESDTSNAATPESKPVKPFSKARASAGEPQWQTQRSVARVSPGPGAAATREPEVLPQEPARTLPPALESAIPRHGEAASGRSDKAPDKPAPLPPPAQQKNWQDGSPAESRAPQGRTQTSKPQTSMPQKDRTQKSSAQKNSPRKTSATAEQEWFSLLKSRSVKSLDRLRQLASQHDLLNKRQGAGSHSRGALALALASGQADVVQWLLAPDTGYRHEEAPGPFLDSVFEDILLKDEAIIAALGVYLNRQEDAKRDELKRHFAEHPPAALWLESLLYERGLIDVTPPKAAAPTRAGKSGKEQNKGNKGDAEFKKSVAAIKDLMKEHFQDEAEVNWEHFRDWLHVSGLNPYQARKKHAVKLLHIAVHRGYENAVKSILAKEGIDPNQAASETGDTPLLMAAFKGHKAVIEALLNFKEIDPNKADLINGVTPLCIAAQAGHIDVVDALLKHTDIDPNKARTLDGATPLCIAVNNRHKDVVDALLKYKNIDPNKATPADGATPLCIAAQHGQKDVVDALLKHKGIDSNKAARDGATPLCIAAQHGHKDVVDALLEHKDIDPNKAMPASGATPLFIASQKGRKDIVKALLNHRNIDPNKAIFNGTTPLQCAISQGNLDIALLLKQAAVCGADQTQERD